MLRGTHPPMTGVIGLRGNRVVGSGKLVALFLAAALVLSGCTVSADGGRWRPIVPSQGRLRANPPAAPTATPAVGRGASAAASPTASAPVVAGPEGVEGAVR